MKNIFPLLLFFFLTSCDALIEPTYYINNKTHSSHTIYYRVYGKDTVVVVPAQTSLLLYKETKVGQKNRFAMIFDSIHIDSVKGNGSEWLKREHWEMEWVNNNQGIYTLTIDSL